MANEQHTEHLTLREMKCALGENKWGFVFPQGDVDHVATISKLLQKAGGKPKSCVLDNFALGGNGKAKPEFIITFNHDPHTILVIECKKSAKKHRSANLDCPNAYAVDGVLYYAKFLKELFDVIAVAVSGTKSADLRVDAFYWGKGLTTYDADLLRKSRDILLEPPNYLNLIHGEKLQKDYSLPQIRETAIEINENLRAIKIVQADKPIFIAGILIALMDEDFSRNYDKLSSFHMILDALQSAIERVLSDSGIQSSRSAYFRNVFNALRENTRFAVIPLGFNNSITWYISRLEVGIKPMMHYAESTIDALGVFYNEFIKYSGSQDGSLLGQVLTPQHLTEFMCELAAVNKNSRVVDICCGTGAFLVTAMSKMFKEANPQEINDIRQNRLYGVESDDGMYTLSVANMIVRHDGKSNIYKGDCFNPQITAALKAKKINIGLINPPYSQKNEDETELHFAEHLLDILVVGGTAVIVAPMACAIGTKFKTERERLLKKHTLRAVFSMPDDIFYPSAATNVCVMVFEAHRPHDSTQETFFGYCKDDGFVKRKKLGRVDGGDWHNIMRQWLKLYRNRDIVDGLSARASVTWKDEWLCEAYMETDYSTLTQEDFQQTVNDYLAYLVKAGDVVED